MAPMSNRIPPSLFLAAAIAAVVSPLVADGRETASDTTSGFPGWPATFEGRPLTTLPLTPREERFAGGFPGRIGRFTDGKREIILRWVDAPTRMLHPAADCFKGSGYRVLPLPISRNASGDPMGCFRAEKGDEAMTVCESVSDGRVRTWSDVSAWYWSSLLGESTGPWWSIVVGSR